MLRGIFAVQVSPPFLCSFSFFLCISAYFYLLNFVTRPLLLFPLHPPPPLTFSLILIDFHFLWFRLLSSHWLNVSDSQRTVLCGLIYDVFKLHSDKNTTSSTSLPLSTHDGMWIRDPQLLSVMLVKPKSEDKPTLNSLLLSHLFPPTLSSCPVQSSQVPFPSLAFKLLTSHSTRPFFFRQYNPSPSPPLHVIHSIPIPSTNFFFILTIIPIPILPPLYLNSLSPLFHLYNAQLFRWRFFTASQTTSSCSWRYKWDKISFK